MKTNHSKALLGLLIFTCTGISLKAQTKTESLTRLTGEDHVHHMLPPSRAAERTVSPLSAPSGNGPVVGALTYHGGPVMTTAVTYAIFWTPPTLQNGAASSLSSSYENIVANFFIALSWT